MCQTPAPATHADPYCVSQECKCVRYAAIERSQSRRSIENPNSTDEQPQADQCYRCGSCEMPHRSTLHLWHASCLTFTPPYPLYRPPGSDRARRELKTTLGAVLARIADGKEKRRRGIKFLYTSKSSSSPSGMPSPILQCAAFKILRCGARSFVGSFVCAAADPNPLLGVPLISTREETPARCWNGSARLVYCNAAPLP